MILVITVVFKQFSFLYIKHPGFPEKFLDDSRGGIAIEPTATEPAPLDLEFCVSLNLLRNSVATEQYVDVIKTIYFVPITEHSFLLFLRNV